MANPRGKIGAIFMRFLDANIGVILSSRPYNQTGYRFYSQTEQHPDSTAATADRATARQCSSNSAAAADRYVSGTYQDR